MADGSSVGLSKHDKLLIMELLHERMRLKDRIAALTPTAIAKKFSVDPSVVAGLARRHAAECEKAKAPKATPASPASRILKVLHEGPDTANNIAHELGSTMRDVCSRLRELEKQGLVASRPFHNADGPAGQRCVLWCLPQHAWPRGMIA